MLRVVAAVLAFLAVVASACDSDNARGDAASPTIETTATPVRGSSVLRLDTFEPVYEAFVAGRVPAGLVNEVTIALASADISGFYIGEDHGRDLYLDLSIVAAASRRDFVEFGGHAYEWWFASRNQVDRYPVQIEEAEPELRIALRFVGGAWGLYVEDAGASWLPLEGTFHFGVFEVSAHVRIDESWRALSMARDKYMRAVIRHEEPVPEGYHVGDIYPRDGKWNVITW
jgi:hypothetical protein